MYLLLVHICLFYVFTLAANWSLSTSISSLSANQPVTGILALYTLALKSSCYDLSTVTFTVGQTTESLLTHLKMQMEVEKEHVACEFSFRLLMGSHKKTVLYPDVLWQYRGQSSQSVKMA